MIALSHQYGKQFKHIQKLDETNFRDPKSFAYSKGAAIIFDLCGYEFLFVIELRLSLELFYFDSQITASSVFNNKHAGPNARLHFKGSENPLRYAGWAAGVKNTNQRLQVDLQQTTRAIGIATQGRHDLDLWVTRYKLQYGDDGQTFRVYKRNGDISDTV